ncbi:hypothetical protein TNCT_289941 [Trichonephila clavata]|uniref:Uncharacterized protein n=1 Tax=Trichonephila clavata TaxID=2740835 RepID=A0A8X6M351_TRICU|nr:hypothetical protein TNCT_289941 [Trichonephila clavata]
MYLQDEQPCRQKNQFKGTEKSQFFPLCLPPKFPSSVVTPSPCRGISTAFFPVCIETSILHSVTIQLRNGFYPTLTTYLIMFNCRSCETRLRGPLLSLYYMQPPRSSPAEHPGGIACMTPSTNSCRRELLLAVA